jgi:prepilin peptidase CpaA
MFEFMILAVVVSGIAAYSDLRSGTIPNWLTLSALAVGVTSHFGRGLALGGLGAAGTEALASLAGALLCSLVPGLMFFKNGMGGGDVKLFAALGALCHPMLGIEAQLYAFVLAALIVPARLAYEGRLLEVLGGSLALALNPFLPQERRRVIPSTAMNWVRLGPAIFGGALLTLALHRYQPLLSWLG